MVRHLDPRPTRPCPLLPLPLPSRPLNHHHHRRRHARRRRRRRRRLHHRRAHPQRPRPRLPPVAGRPRRQLLRMRIRPPARRPRPPDILPIEIVIGRKGEVTPAGQHAARERDGGGEEGRRCWVADRGAAGRFEGDGGRCQDAVQEGGGAADVPSGEAGEQGDGVVVVAEG